MEDPRQGQEQVLFFVRIDRLSSSFLSLLISVLWIYVLHIHFRYIPINQSVFLIFIFGDTETANFHFFIILQVVMDNPSPNDLMRSIWRQHRGDSANPPKQPRAKRGIDRMEEEDQETAPTTLASENNTVVAVYNNIRLVATWKNNAVSAFTVVEETPQRMRERVIVVNEEIEFHIGSDFKADVYGTSVDDAHYVVCRTHKFKGVMLDSRTPGMLVNISPLFPELQGLSRVDAVCSLAGMGVAIQIPGCLLATYKDPKTHEQKTLTETTFCPGLKYYSKESSLAFVRKDGYLCYHNVLGGESKSVNLFPTGGYYADPAWFFAANNITDISIVSFKERLYIVREKRLEMECPTTGMSVSLSVSKETPPSTEKASVFFNYCRILKSTPVASLLAVYKSSLWYIPNIKQLIDMNRVMCFKMLDLNNDKSVIVTNTSSDDTFIAYDGSVGGSFSINGVDKQYERGISASAPHFEHDVPIEKRLVPLKSGEVVQADAPPQNTMFETLLAEMKLNDPIPTQDKDTPQIWTSNVLNKPRTEKGRRKFDPTKWIGADLASTEEHMKPAVFRLRDGRVPPLHPTSAGGLKNITRRMTDSQLRELQKLSSPQMDQSQ